MKINKTSSNLYILCTSFAPRFFGSLSLFLTSSNIDRTSNEHLYVRLQWTPFIAYYARPVAGLQFKRRMPKHRWRLNLRRQFPNSHLAHELHNAVALKQWPAAESTLPYLLAIASRASMRASHRQTGTSYSLPIMCSYANHLNQFSDLSVRPSLFTL